MESQIQLSLFDGESSWKVPPFKTQLLKWIGNKQRFSHEIISYFPNNFKNYCEPFLGSGAVMGTLSPKSGIGSDAFKPLIEIWQKLKENPDELIAWYTERWDQYNGGDYKAEYEKIKASYNARPNGADLLFLCRSCYGGVVRFRMNDGYMSTPCGVHKPIQPCSFANRVYEWHSRTVNVDFFHMDFEESFEMGKSGDMFYCDPPYKHSQQILYKGQSFRLGRLLECIEKAKSKGIHVALSIDGTKKSGKVNCELPIPKGLFKREVYVNCGRSMLKRFQMGGKTLEGERVSDRLLLTY